MAGSERYRLEASGITVEVDLGIGHLALIEIERDGRKTAPFHRAPWADDAAPPAGTEDAPHLARISGDFFCAPFRLVRRRAGALAWLAGQRRMEPRRQPARRGRRHHRDLRAGEAGHGRARAEGTDAARRPSLPLPAPHFRGRRGRCVRSPTTPWSGCRTARALPTRQSAGRRRQRRRWKAIHRAAIRSSPIPAARPISRAIPRADGGTVDLTSYPIDQGHEDFVDAGRSGRLAARLVGSHALRGRRHGADAEEPGQAAGHHALVFERRPQLCALERQAQRRARRRGRLRLVAIRPRRIDRRPIR